MASIETRTTKAGQVHRVRYRHAGRNMAETFDTRKQAETWKALLEQVGHARAIEALGQPQAAASRTVAQQVEHHIAHLTGVTEGTKSDYRSYLRKDIAPHIGNVPLPLLDRDAVARWVNQLAAQGLAGKSIRNRHSLLSAALTGAVRDGLIVEHPSKGMRLPRTDHERREMTFLTHDEFAQLRDLLPERWRPLALLLVGTGMRWGEATALTVGDVDLVTSTARIRQAWKHTDGNGYELGPPKSTRSTRTVPLPAGVRETIRPLIARRPPDAFVFLNTRGEPVRQNAFHGDVWTPAVRQFAGDVPRKIPTGGRPKIEWIRGHGKRPRIHDLRHTFASWAIQAGIPLPVIQRSLGHESITTTIDTYGHLARSDFDALALATDQALTRPPPALD